MVGAVAEVPTDFRPDLYEPNPALHEGEDPGILKACPYCNLEKRDRLLARREMEAQHARDMKEAQEKHLEQVRRAQSPVIQSPFYPAVWAGGGYTSGYPIQTSVNASLQRLVRMPLSEAVNLLGQAKYHSYSNLQDRARAIREALEEYDGALEGNKKG